MPMDPSDIVKYKNLYLQTAWGYLNSLIKNVAFLLNDPKDQKAIEVSHIAAHSLKSQSILMGYTQIGKLSEQMEVIFKSAKDNTFTLNKEILEAIVAGLKKVHVSLERVAENGSEVDMHEESNKIEELFKK